MEKISGILPASARVKAVDLRGAHPARPGVPSFGQPIGATTSERLNISLQAKEAARAAMVEQLANNFFESQTFVHAPKETLVPPGSSGDKSPPVGGSLTSSELSPADIEGSEK